MKKIPAFLFFLLAPALSWPAPRAAVLVVIDQMRADHLERFAGKTEGGFSRLLKEGASFPFASVPFVPTDTAPGHASLATGLLPKDHGIIGNRWYNRETGKVDYVLPGEEASPVQLLSPTLGDRLKEIHPNAWVGAFSLKDRSAVLLAGKKADAAIWLNKKTGEFSTSSFYPSPPSWFSSFSSSHIPFEKGKPLSPKRVEDFLASPNSDRALLDVVSAFVHKEVPADPQAPVLLLVSFSGLDYVGHGSGPFSEEAARQLEALDDMLEDLFSLLEGKFGQDGFVLCLSADHGALPVPEGPEGKAMNAEREHEKVFLENLEKTVASLFPRVETPWVEAVTFPHVFFNRALADKLKLDWKSFLNRVAAEMGFMEEIAAVYNPADWSRGLADSYLEIYQNSAAPGRSGDLLIRLTEGLLVKKYYVKTGHGSPYPYDARVPLAFFGPGLKPGQKNGTPLLTDVAPTLGSWFGVEFPAGAGRSLRSLLEAASPQ